MSYVPAGRLSNMNVISLPVPFALMIPFIILALPLVMDAGDTSLFQLSFALNVRVTGVAAPVLSFSGGVVPTSAGVNPASLTLFQLPCGASPAVSEAAKAGVGLE